jgi:hypothetical protein
VTIFSILGFTVVLSVGGDIIRFDHRRTDQPGAGLRSRGAYRG